MDLQIAIKKTFVEVVAEGKVLEKYPYLTECNFVYLDFTDSQGIGMDEALTAFKQKGYDGVFGRIGKPHPEFKPLVEVPFTLRNANGKRREHRAFIEWNPGKLNQAIKMHQAATQAFLKIEKENPEFRVFGYAINQHFCWVEFMGEEYDFEITKENGNWNIQEGGQDSKYENMTEAFEFLQLWIQKKIEERKLAWMIEKPKENFRALFAKSHRNEKTQDAIYEDLLQRFTPYQIERYCAFVKDRVHADYLKVANMSAGYPILDRVYEFGDEIHVISFEQWVLDDDDEPKELLLTKLNEIYQKCIG